MEVYNEIQEQQEAHNEIQEQKEDHNVALEVVVHTQVLVMTEEDHNEALNHGDGPLGC